MLMNADVGEGGVENQPKNGDVVYGRPLGEMKHLIVVIRTPLLKRTASNENSNTTQVKMSKIGQKYSNLNLTLAKNIIFKNRSYNNANTVGEIQ